MNHETEYDTDFDQATRRYANKLILCDGAIIAVISLALFAIYVYSK